MPACELGQETQPSPVTAMETTAGNLGVRSSRVSPGLACCQATRVTGSPGPPGQG